MAKNEYVFRLRLAAGIFMLMVSCSWAGDLTTEPLEIRLWLAMSRAINSTDAIGREASAAYLSASSDNPAASDVRHVEPVSARGFICAGTHHIAFSDGAWIIAEDVNGFLRFNNAGTLSMGYVHFASQNGQTRQGFEDDIRNHEFLIKYGRQISPTMYLGAGVTINDMTVDYGDLYQGLPRNTYNHSISGSFTFGSLWQPKPNWTFGMLVGAGWTGSDIEGAVHAPGPVDVPFRTNIKTRTMNFKTGFRWRIAPSFRVYSDAQYFRLDNSMSAEDAGRFYFGADVDLSRRIILMAGSSVDTNGHTTGSSGFGINMMKPGTLKPTLFKLTYQYNPLPELSQEFGTGHLVSATMVFSF